MSDAEQDDLVTLLKAAGPSTTTVPVQLARRGGGAHAADASVRLVTSPVLGVVLDFRPTGGDPDGVDVDELTGLAGRTAFFDHVAELAARPEAIEVAVAFLDIDNFKTINDALGHDQGDVLLKTIAHRLRDAVGEGGLVARFGGDEFVVVMDGPAGRGLSLVEDCIRSVFADPIVLENKPFVISASVGIVTATDRDELRPEHLLKAADTAMYESKRRGKDRLTVYDESLHHEATSRLAMESDLRVALDRGEFELHYQPIMDVVTGRPIGAEALLRWVHPERGMVRPDLFIPIAEATGLILPIGAWVLETAIAQAAEWNRGRRRRRALSISVNLSGHQLSDPDLEQRIHAALSRTGLDPNKLTLEVTESTLMLDRSGATDVLERIRARGIGIAIDDFGTGYSSLAYLKRLPARTLKIDKAFVDGLGIQAEDTALVTGIVGLASALDLLIVAEGVETETQLRELRRLGCEYSQGYLHSRPLPNDAFVAWLASVEPDSSATTMDFEREATEAALRDHPRVATSDVDELGARRMRREGAGFGF